mgnify:CR=1 FL=1
MNTVEAFNKRKSLFFKKENIYSFLLIFIIFSLDRISKIKIINDFKESTFFINDFVNIDLIWNTGIGFGLLSSDTALVYNLISTLIGSVIVILLFISFTSEKFEKLIFSILIGGALGNWYDRIFYSAVPDFIDLHYNSFHWFTFNIADIFITVGIITFIAKDFFIKIIK